MTRASVYIPPIGEPGKVRAAWSGHSGEHVTVGDWLEEARAALDAGDVKATLGAVQTALMLNGRAGRGLGLPAEAPEQKSLKEAEFFTSKALDDIRLWLQPKESNLVRAGEALARAIAARS